LSSRNKFEQALDSMKLDLVVFSANGGIMRRFITEMAPLRPMKTVVRAFSVESRVLSDRRDLGERCDRLRAH
jgi:prephenate dehydrogenase